jgi:hypothetical protein
MFFLKVKLVVLDHVSEVSYHLLKSFAASLRYFHLHLHWTPHWTILKNWQLVLIPLLVNVNAVL